MCINHIEIFIRGSQMEKIKNKKQTKIHDAHVYLLCGKIIYLRIFSGRGKGQIHPHAVPEYFALRSEYEVHLRVLETEYERLTWVTERVLRRYNIHFYRK